VKLRDFFPGDIGSDAECGIQELMRTILMRSQFVPGVRYSLGWRGLKQSITPELEGWTARIDKYEGVYGLSFTGVADAPGWVCGAFNLSYFPNSAETLVEHCSLQAAAWTQKPDYMSFVREFLQYKDMISLFFVGTVFLAIDFPQKALYLGMESLTAQRSIASDGVWLPQNGQMVQLIHPGGYDQDFPAYSVTHDFFEVLAASLSFHLEQPPSWLHEMRFPGAEITYDNKGTVKKTSASDIDNVIVGLGYGYGPFGELFKAHTKTNNDLRSEIKWKEGDAVPPDYEKKCWWFSHSMKDYKTLNKKSLGIDERPPLMILSGFLGSGKTSFLRHFIEYQTQRSRFVAVIQNEIGEVGLDGKLLDYEVTEIDEGCVCCSLVGNLKRAVHGILSNFQPDFIILETTGAANPFNLFDEISELEDFVRYDCTVTVVDGLNLDYSLSHFSIAADQIRAANVLILNKCDLINETCRQTACQQIKNINPQALLFMTTNGDLNPALIFDTGSRWEGKNIPVAAESELPVFPTHAHDEVWSKTLPIPEPLNRSEFLSAVEALPHTVFRVKGIIEFSDSPHPMLFQYVAGRFELSQFSNSTVKERFLTVIAQGTRQEGFFSLIPALPKNHEPCFSTAKNGVAFNLFQPEKSNIGAAFSEVKQSQRD